MASGFSELKFFHFDFRGVALRLRLKEGYVCVVVITMDLFTS